MPLVDALCCSLPRLEVLDVSYNSLTGPLPRCLGQMQVRILLLLFF
jgi:hypothetical protein